MAILQGPPSPFPHPLDDPESWNTLTIGGIQVPGIIEFPRYKKGRKIDEKGSPGTDGATVTDKGTNLADVEIKVTIWKREHFPAWFDLYHKKISAGRPLAERNVETVVHPSLYADGITRLYFFENDSLQPHPSIPLAYTITLKAKEFSAKTRIGSATKTPKPAPDPRTVKSVFTKEALARSQGQQTPADAAARLRAQYAADAGSLAPGLSDLSSPPAEMGRTFAERAADTSPEALFLKRVSSP